METIDLAKGVALHVHPTDQFKDVTIQVSFLSPMDLSQRAARLCLSLMMSDVCAAYPTKQAASAVLDELYGAELLFYDEAKGKADLYQAVCTAVDQKYVRESDLLQRQFAVLSQFLFHPLLTGDAFSARLFQECKQKALTMVRMTDDQPMDAAAQKAAALYGGFFAGRNLPSPAEVEALQNEETVRVYRQILQESAVDIFVLGRVDAAECQRLARRYFALPQRTAARDILYCACRPESVQAKEQRAISQSYLVQIYDTGHSYLDPLLPAMMLGNGILGALPTSFLFQEVREKRSLCYSISSEHSPLEGILQISTAMEAKNVSLACTLIQKQIEKVQKGQFSDEMLATARQMYINSWRSSMDHERSLLLQDHLTAITGCQADSSTMIQRFETVTREQIMAAFAPLCQKVTFLLEQENSDE